MPAKDVRTSQCSCGQVAFEAAGAPILSAICYCDSCQAGARQIGALPGAAPILTADSGTEYVLYRKDRVRCTKGAGLQRKLKLTEATATNRVVSTCCNSAMLVNFDDSKHWVSMYRPRFGAGAPPPALRICTKYRPPGPALASDLPNYPGYPPGFIVKLIAARIAMLFGS